MPLIFKGAQWMHTERPINIEEHFTLEALLSLDGDGQDSTIFCQPISEDWSTPYVSYRLGFHGNTCQPEFQFSLAEQDDPISIISPQAVSKKTALHVAGSYDGNIGRLYVNGKQVATEEVTGSIRQSEQPAVIGGRSKTNPGGYLVGTLHEIRLMKVVRTAKEIDFWKNKPLGPVKVWNLDTPKPPEKEDYLGLWSA